MRRTKSRRTKSRRTKYVWVLAMLVGLASAAPASAKQMSVQVERLQVRERPSALGKPVGYLEYGERVTVLEQQNSWVNVQAEGGVSGWAHESAFTRKRVVLKGGGSAVDIEASDEEVAFAGKGFNSQIEAEFKLENPEVERQFALIDEIETVNNSASEIAAFLEQGGVQPVLEGGAE